MSKHDWTLEDSSNDGSVSSVDEAKPTPEAGSGDAIPGRQLILHQVDGHGSYWETDLSCSESTNVIQSAMESRMRDEKKIC